MEMHTAIVDNVSVESDRPIKQLDRARVLYSGSSIFFVDADHLLALAHAAGLLGEDGAYLYAPSAVGDADAAEPPDVPVWIDILELGRIVERCEANDKQPQKTDFDGVAPEAMTLLFNYHASEWSVFSTRGEWIWSAWDNADFAAIAGSDKFMTEYLAHRPSSVDDASTWISAEGHIFATSVNRPRSRRPRVPAFWYRVIGNEEYLGSVLEGSTLEIFLNKLYGQQVAQELWWIHSEMELLSANPFFGDAWKELSLLKKRLPWLESRLLEIWNGEGRVSEESQRRLRESSGTSPLVPPGARVRQL